MEVTKLKRKVLLLVMGGALAVCTSRCGVPLAVAIPTFTTASIVGAGAAVGAGAIDLSYFHLTATPSPTPAPLAQNPKWLPQDPQ